MRKLTFYIFLAVFPLMVLYYSSNNQIAPSRTIASLEKGSSGCVEIIKNFFKPEKNVAAAELKTLLSSLSKYSVESRLYTLELLGKLNIKSNEVRRKYAELLNNSFKSNIISQAELVGLVTKINEKSEWVKIGKNNIVYVDLLEDFAKPEDIKNAINTLISTEESRSKFYQKIYNLELNLYELDALKSLPESISDERMEKSISYLLYVRSLKIDDQPTALSHLAEISQDVYPDLVFANTFKKFQKEIQTFIEDEKRNGVDDLWRLREEKFLKN